MYKKLSVVNHAIMDAFFLHADENHKVVGLFDQCPTSNGRHFVLPESREQLKLAKDANIFNPGYESLDDMRSPGALIQFMLKNGDIGMNRYVMDVLTGLLKKLPTLSAVSDKQARYVPVGVEITPKHVKVLMSITAYWTFPENRLIKLSVGQVDDVDRVTVELAPLDKETAKAVAKELGIGQSLTVDIFAIVQHLLGGLDGPYTRKHVNLWLINTVLTIFEKIEAITADVIAAFDLLVETRTSAGDCLALTSDGSIIKLARAIPTNITSSTPEKAGRQLIGDTTTALPAEPPETTGGWDIRQELAADRHKEAQAFARMRPPPSPLGAARAVSPLGRPAVGVLQQRQPGVLGAPGGLLAPTPLAGGRAAPTGYRSRSLGGIR